jgi:hypothetical protein
MLFSYTSFTGECVASMMAHQDAVSSISIDSGGLYLTSGGMWTVTVDSYLIVLTHAFETGVGHEGSMRIWSIAERQCVFETQVRELSFTVVSLVPELT